ncbi:probable methyltransferase-like protein 15 homolog [Phlebotomus argentipes]|uniref:probable methyltransferase-like protein 15 homolog n=1 Tax=Phlebotomus argentipes TaxID=94469 RepID=UPI002892C31F|nr:probable methyltransferase-like protein 15 homolog [Phlebotomus argentipes]
MLRKYLIPSLVTARRLLQTQISENIQTCVPHKPVMVKEVLENLKPSENQTILDMTFGAGGHSRQILNSAPNIRLLALDRDPVAHEYAKELQKEFPDQIVPLLGRFSELPQLLQEAAVEQNSIDGILFDFGCSSMQFEVAERGFSVVRNAPLDMRMDGKRFPEMPTAADVLARAGELDLYRIFKVYGEEKNARKIARAIVQARYGVKRIETTKELVDLVSACCEEDFRLDLLHRPTSLATKVFQALRIFVNNELNEINYGMILAQRFVKVGGRVVTITFHSLEDKIVKRHIMGNVTENMANPLPLKYVSHTLIYDQDSLETLTDTGWLSLHKHVLTPRPEEIEQNPRSRSAKLRAAIRLD